MEKKKIKPINPTQPEAKRFKFYQVRGNCGFYWVRIFIGRTYWVRKNNESQLSPPMYTPTYDIKNKYKSKKMKTIGKNQIIYPEKGTGHNFLPIIIKKKTQDKA